MVSSRFRSSCRSRSPSHDRSRHSRRSRSRSASTDRHNQRHKHRRSRSRSHSRDRGDRVHRDSERNDRSDRAHDRHREKDHHLTQKQRRAEAQRAEEAKAADRSRYASMTGAQIERERTKKRQMELARLSREDYQEWKSKLQALDLSRESIKQAMGFAFDKVESAEEVRCCFLFHSLIIFYISVQCGFSLCTAFIFLRCI